MKLTEAQRTALVAIAEHQAERNLEVIARGDAKGVDHGGYFKSTLYVNLATARALQRKGLVKVYISSRWSRGVNITAEGREEAARCAPAE